MATPGAAAERIVTSGELFAKVGDVELCYETFGNPANPAMLMIMGLGSQMILWSEEFCEMLAERGFFVIRFDNRDAGRSTKIAVDRQPSLTRVLAGHREEAPYLLADMADDTAGLLDHLGIASAHVVAASLGGMVGQMLAIRHPERVLSLASVMSTTGEGSVGQPHPETILVLLNRPPDDRDGFVQHFLETRAAIGTAAFPRDPAKMRRLGERYYERGPSPDGTLRQLAASIASGDRTDDLKRLDVPTVVIHGEEDPLIDVSGGRATAAAIPGAELLVIPGMGHDLPEQLWDQIVEAIVKNTKRTSEA
jgi:pimeloyl-ACP methyl ester carboxylesterase